ncbi:uncharacterized protein LOC141607172 [Silene latifolia]|uniref:uncharacterized protein LOC141607172 n=1 Tax=Silene latifolia TaxID=37657 RepID=UPI003D7869FD
MEDFQACLDYCHLLDSPTVGSFYTWNNKQDPQTRVYSRLDRVLVNSAWLQQRYQSYAHFYNEGLFDHTLCIVTEATSCMKGRRSFKYFNMWSQIPDFHTCVQHQWNKYWQGTKVFRVVMKLKSVKNPLKNLNKHHFDDIENSVVHAWKVLDSIQDHLKISPNDPDLIEKERTAANIYRELQKCLLQYYKELLVTTGTVSKCFLKDAWPIIGDEVSEAILDFFQYGKLLQQLNHTFITLIPKVNIPQNVTQFRPISCCNILYKAISKILCTRLSTVLPKVINKSQGGFIKGRSIVENILICQDIVRLYNKKAISPRSLIKIDLKKAYESIHWDFVEQMLNALQFPAKFVQLVMTCIKSTSYSLVLNGENFGYFHGAKGLRQRDPISSLLFTITMKYLSRILTHVTDTMPFKFHLLCNHLRLSHLIFANDFFMFSKGDITSIMILLRAFATFSVATGLQMNTLKSNIYFNGVSSSVKADILQVSGFLEGSLLFKYLGVPISVGRLSIKNCSILIQKVNKRIRGYAAKKLSYSGRLTLVNSVLSTLYTYWANIFVLPKGVLKKIEALCRNFLWDGSTEYLRVLLVSWEKVCVPKCEGSLGIRDSYAWNLAAFCKLSWWIYTKPGSFWVQWIHHVYMKGANWTEYTPKPDSSWSWKTISKVRLKFAAGFSNTGQWLPMPYGYSPSSGYQWIRKKQPLVTWDKLIWNSWCILKHNFIKWLIARDALRLKDKLLLLGVTVDANCFLCGNGCETHNRVFRHCCYTKQLIHLLSCKIRMHLPDTNLLEWVHSKPWAKVKKRVIVAWIQALFYAIWLQRNKARLDGVLLRPEVVIQQICRLLKFRSIYWLKCTKRSSDEEWIKSIKY